MRKDRPDAPPGSPLDVIVTALIDHGSEWDGGTDWTCPAHDDEHASLGVGVGDKQPVVLSCGAGCDSDDVLDALGLTWDDLKPKRRSLRRRRVASWDYTDEEGKKLYRVERWEDASGGKTFAQVAYNDDGSDRKGQGAMKGVRRVLYELPAVLEVAAEGGHIVVCEGEKAADAINARTIKKRPGLGRPWATTAAQGAKATWLPEFTTSLAGAGLVTVIADRDDAGLAHAAEVYAALTSADLPVEVRQSATTGAHDDVVDHFEAGHQWRDLMPLDPADLPSPTAVLADHPYNDAGNAARLLSAHADDLKWLTDLGKWAGWNGRAWVVGDAPANRYALEVVRGLEERARALVAGGEKEEAGKLASFATRSGNDGSLRAMLRQASTLPGLAARSSDLDADPSVLTVDNGTLDLTPGGARLREHRRDDLARSVVPLPYVEGARSERWETFLSAALPDDEVRRFAARLAGYALLGANPERLLVFLIGPSSTGKSTFVELLAKTLGPSLAGPFDLSLLRDLGKEAARPDLVLAMGRRLIFTSEASADHKLHGDKIKRIVGNDSTTARAMRSDDFVERVPAFLPVIATNAPPTIEHADPALWRRLVVVPFESVATNPDPYLRATFDADDLAGVLAWAVRGWDDYAAHGLTDRPAAVLAATERLREGLSTVDQFLTDRCRADADEWTPSAELFSAYEDWCADEGVRPADRLPHNRFGEMLEQRGFEMKLRRVGSRTDDRKVRGRVGLSVLEAVPTGRYTPRSAG